MPGPLRSPNARRKNSPLVHLPAEGRLGRTRDVVPAPPFDLGPVAQAWWEWAWRTPQSFGWSEGDVWVLARRAEMEEPKTVLARGGMAVEVEGGTPTEKLAIDDRLGLTPRGMAQLHWTIVEAERPAPAGEEPAEGVSSLAARRAALTAEAS